MLNRIWYITLFFVFLFIGCNTKDDSEIFQLLSSDHTGVTFTNAITTNDSLNAQTDFFLYNGAGVAVGDINNNGLPDLFFSGNMVTSRLYLNKGGMQFEDITDSAGIKTDRRATGVSMVDINNNGYLDIYVSVSGAPWSTPEERKNLLFINNGDQTFTESASKFRIDDEGFTTHAVFFDYNLNGHLDLFLLSNSPEEFGRGETGSRPGRTQNEDSISNDQLYRNNGDGTFTNVSEEAGILKKLGYGLGVVATDMNGNGFPDIYVSNDITPNDVLYINNGDGTFTDKAADYLNHTSFAGMGIDIADFTNNGWPDILQTDMMPEELKNRKRISGSTTYSGFTSLRRDGYFPHYNVNSLQMNHGVTEDGDIVFSEIARMAGVAYTDWSWTALFGDYNNNGLKDIFITNGYPKAVNDFDYLSDMHNARQIRDSQQRQEKEREILRNLHGYEIPNYLFKNNGDLTFTDKSKEWGALQPGFSYGAAQADLNNNGRLDLIVNNIDAEAFIYENIAPHNESHNYLQFKLNGDDSNIRGLGSKLILTANGQKQFIYHTPYRGYMSTMDDRAHFGLGKAITADSLEVIWPDGKYQLITELEANQVITLHHENAADRDHSSADSNGKNKLFEAISSEDTINYRHRDSGEVDYSTQPLIPYMISKQGPPIAVGDVTGNGLDDVFIGGSANYAGKLFLQQKDGTFAESEEPTPWEEDSAFEDWGTLFFDANGNGLLDLYVASGGYNLSSSSPLLQDRLYINHGNSRFIRDPEALPEMITSTSAIAKGDFTGDGNPDLFIGGRLTPRNYPSPSRSYILKNDNGKFTDVTADIAPELSEPTGMITDAVWIDFNGNGHNDLVTAGEWMSIQFFENDGEQLKNVSDDLNLPSMKGWWYSLSAGDFNNNGYIDLVAGNLGLNYTYTTSKESPFGVYAIEAGGLQSPDIVLAKNIDGTEYPFDGLAKLGRENYEIALRFSSFDSYSKASLSQIFGSTKLENAMNYHADTFASVIIQNNGDGSFTSSPLPNSAQISPIKSIMVHDVENDGNLDLIIAGNIYHTEPNNARADAGKGLWLKGDGRGNFNPISPIESGFIAPKDARHIAIINTPSGKAVLVANNNDSLQIFSIVKE